MGGGLSRHGWRDVPVSLPGMRATRDQIIAAQDAWQDAHRAYRDEAGKYAKRWWMGEGPPPEDAWPEPVTREELQKLTRLREAEGEALAAYRAVLGER
jgi:hypothetical protein